MSEAAKRDGAIGAMAETYEAWAEAHGTPFYHYDLDRVRAAHRSLAGHLPAGALILYSIKANPHPDVARALRECGASAEVTSTGELAVALAAGFAAGELLYVGPAKSRHELDAAVVQGVRRITAESFEDLARIKAAARRHDRVLEVVLRLNPERRCAELGMTMVGVASQFGLDEAEIRARAAELTDCDLVRVVGFQIYYGSQIPQTRLLLATFREAMEASAELAAAIGLQVRYLDLGGGFGGPFARPGEKAVLDGLAEGICELLDQHFPNRPDDFRLVFESGRYLVCDAGWLVARVEAVKLSKGRTFVILDTGVNHLGGMSGVGRLPKLDLHLEALRPTDDAATMVADVVGPLCSPLDCLARGVQVPQLSAGDLVAVPNVGAYGLSVSLAGFLSRPYPAEIVTESDAPPRVSRLVAMRDSLSSGG